ncbi:MAG TPA: demethoxyubiquinone hydroxylase family protein [Rhizomicrobium sp.]|nr:demethoxyubiquinone hydroxylase family protein [Rhizomicrobium sp.]
MTPRRRRRPAAPGTPVTPDVAEMIRVDHAGEFGAMRIYEGQLAVLEARGHDKRAVTAIRRMAEQESRHLARFNMLVNQRNVRPTALSPLWHAAGFALGAGTALLGTRAAMACTAAVEQVIDDHYARQIDRLDGDPELKEAVTEFREDEIAHRDEALAHGAEDAPAYRLLSETIKAGCRLAIRLSEKI